MRLNFLQQILVCLSKLWIFKAVKPRECVSNDIVFAGDETNVRVELFNVIEPANDTVRSGVVSGDVEMISVDV